MGGSKVSKRPEGVVGKKKKKRGVGGESGFVLLRNVSQVLGPESVKMRF